MLVAVAVTYASLWPAETSVYQTAALVESASHTACTAEEIKAAFKRAKTCVDARADARPASSDKTAFCKYVEKTGDCF